MLKDCHNRYWTVITQQIIRLLLVKQSKDQLYKVCPSAMTHTTTPTGGRNVRGRLEHQDPCRPLRVQVQGRTPALPSAIYHTDHLWIQRCMRVSFSPKRQLSALFQPVRHEKYIFCIYFPYPPQREECNKLHKVYNIYKYKM